MNDDSRRKLDFKKFKKYLLRSGLPLEVSVTQKIKEHGLLDQGEYQYIRDGKVFSIDINALNWADFVIYYRHNLFILDFLVECKYHEEDRNWLFISFEKKGEFSFRSMSSNIFIDFPMEKRLNDYEYHQQYRKTKYFEHYAETYSKFFPKDTESVQKGIEIYKDGFNPKSITESIFQLSFGIGSAIVQNVKDLIENEEEEIQGDDGYIYLGGNLGFFIVPIIVTTANLHILNRNVGVDEIKKSKSLKGIAKPVKAVIFEQSSYYHLNEYIRNSITFKDLMLKSDFFKDDDIDDKIKDLSDIDPRILIVSYNHLDSILQLLMDELDSHFNQLRRYWSKKTKKKKK